MAFDKRRIATLSVFAIALLLPLTCGIRVSVSSNTGTFSEEIEGADDDTVFGRTVIGGEGLSHAIKGSGNLKSSHQSAKSGGAYSGSGADVSDAEQYYYTYELVRGARPFWPDYRYPEIKAQETLDVVDADSIEVYANAVNAKGEVKSVSTIVPDPDKKVSLIGYINRAIISGDRIAAFEDVLEGRCSDAPWSLVQKLLTNPYEPESYDVAVGTRVLAGSMERFWNEASSRGRAAGSGQHINTSADGSGAESMSTTWMRTLDSLNRTIKGSNNTTIEGSLTGFQQQV